MKNPMEFKMPSLLGVQIKNSIKAITANRMVAEELDKTLSDRLDELARNICFSLIEELPQGSPLRVYFNEWENTMFNWIRGSLHFSGEDICWKSTEEQNFFEIYSVDIKNLLGKKHLEFTPESFAEAKEEMMNLLNKAWPSMSFGYWTDAEDHLRFKLRF